MSDPRIEKVIGRFDFGRVHSAMTDMDWQWKRSPAPHVPTIRELRDEAISLLESTLGEYQRVECGGFIAENRDGHLSLTFAITGADDHDDE